LDDREVVGEDKVVASLPETKIEVLVHQAEVDPIGILPSLRGVLIIYHYVRQQAQELERQPAIG
jgi:hypothetical protein